jgi:hypothetical protein
MYNDSYSSSEENLIKMAFNLYNGCAFRYLTPIDIFRYNEEISKVILTAVSIIFNTVFSF